MERIAERKPRSRDDLSASQKTVLEKRRPPSIISISLKRDITGIKTIKQFYGELNDWKQISSLIPANYLSPNLKKTGHAGIFSAALELVREGNISIKQKSLFEEIYIKEN